jgi:cytochrome c
VNPLFVEIMNSHLFLPVLALATLYSSSAFANEVAAASELARASGCYSCHAPAEKIVGPAFRDVAAKYAANKDAVDSLTQSIKNGARGKWGRIPMPPHPSLSGSELKELATWVMSHKP